MAQIGKTSEIVEVKEHLERMKQDGLIVSWELPYGDLLTRRSAAIFFVTPENDKLSAMCKQLERYPDFRCRFNQEKKLSQLQHRVEFNKEGE
ncbi:hypothetical protein PMSD_25130 [Paenibacillus macquariensis subsp. defensor]|nr:hypothetical protein PMSD_25130 [Paenibacillus macquariensis subsp. defensor]